MLAWIPLSWVPPYNIPFQLFMVMRVVKDKQNPQLESCRENGDINNLIFRVWFTLQRGESKFHRITESLMLKNTFKAM